MKSPLTAVIAQVESQFLRVLEPIARCVLRATTPRSTRFQINLTTVALLAWIVPMLTSCGQTPAKFEMFGFAPGMTYSQIQAKATALKAKVINNGAGQVQLLLPEPITPGRPLMVTLVLNGNDQAKTVIIQETNGVNDPSLVAAAMKRWGKPLERKDGSAYPTLIWGNLSNLHAEHQNEQYNSYRGCVCVKIIDPALERASTSALKSIAAAPPQTLAVTGITLGSRFDDVVARFRHDGFQVAFAKFSWQGESAVVATAGSGAKNERYIVEGVNGNIFRVQHVVNFPFGQQPKTDETLSALHAKYGRTSSEASPQQTGHTYYEYTWTYSPEGRAIGQACPHDGKGENIFTSLGNYQLEIQMSQPCEFGAISDIHVDMSTDTVTSIFVDLYNFKAYREFTNARTHSEQEGNSAQVLSIPSAAKAALHWFDLRRD
jgi:hypothetical protein